MNALAAGLEYSYAEFGYTNIDSDRIDKGDGISALVSYAALDYVHVKLGYTRVFDIDEYTKADATVISDPDIDINRFSVGVGGNYSLTDSVDVLATLSYIDEEYTGSDLKASEEGYLLEAGVRAQAAKKVELNAMAAARHLAGESDTGFGVGAVIKLKKKFSISARANHFSDDDETEIFLGLRLNL